MMHPELNITCDYYSGESQVVGFVGRDVFDETRVYHEWSDFKIKHNDTL